MARGTMLCDALANVMVSGAFHPLTTRRAASPRQLQDLFLGQLPRVDGREVGLESGGVAVADQVELAGLLGRRAGPRRRRGTR